MVLLATAKAKKVDHLRERRNNERQYVFDVVFGADSTQDEVYTATTKHLVDNVLAGYNATVFAYGESMTADRLVFLLTSSFLHRSHGWWEDLHHGGDPGQPRDHGEGPQPPVQSRGGGLR